MAMMSRNLGAEGLAHSDAMDVMGVMDARLSWVSVVRPR